ncbi:MAG: hypothetical protein IIX21_02320 [Clostridia bacterium]|nr:hypothetical protein [Clostridia bacterium]
MKKYTTPQMKISMFDVETVTADVTNPLSQPVYGNNLETYIQNKQKVQRNLDFNKAIKFK